MSEMALSLSNPKPTAQGTRLYDVFNGDADGICALHQLRLADPKDAVLVTGVKRDIELLQRVECQSGIEVTVLDVSLDVNAAPLRRILEGGGRVTYFDHHSARFAFQHPRLELHWDEAPDVCTSVLVNRHLRGRFRQWAAVAAFGDNLAAVGRSVAHGLDEPRIQGLEKLGHLLNYNAYGETVEDLHVAPDKLYRVLHEFTAPFDFIEASPFYRLLEDGYRKDAARMENLRPNWEAAYGTIYILPRAAWARRISGIFANRLAATSNMSRSHAVLTEKDDGGYVVSVRSGSAQTHGANGLCEQFAGGGGRKAAAGINNLPASELDNFIKAFSEYFCATSAQAEATRAE